MATADLLTPKPPALAAAIRRRHCGPTPNSARMHQLGLFAGRDVELIGGVIERWPATSVNRSSLRERNTTHSDRQPLLLRLTAYN